jgi:hypothetical protein
MIERRHGVYDELGLNLAISDLLRSRLLREVVLHE